MIDRNIYNSEELLESLPVSANISYNDISVNNPNLNLPSKSVSIDNVNVCNIDVNNARVLDLVEFPREYAITQNNQYIDVDFMQNSNITFGMPTKRFKAYVNIPSVLSSKIDITNVRINTVDNGSNVTNVVSLSDFTYVDYSNTLSLSAGYSVIRIILINNDNFIGDGWKIIYYSNRNTDGSYTITLGENNQSVFYYHFRDTSGKVGLEISNSPINSVIVLDNSYVNNLGVRNFTWYSDQYYNFDLTIPT